MPKHYASKPKPKKKKGKSYSKSTDTLMELGPSTRAAGKKYGRKKR